MRLVKDRDRSQERPWNLNPWIFFNLTGQSLQQSKLTLKSALLWTGDGLGGPAVPSDIACAMISYSHICRVPDELDFWALPSHITILPLPYGIYINKSKKPGKDLIVSSQKKKKKSVYFVLRWQQTDLEDEVSIFLQIKDKRATFQSGSQLGRLLHDFFMWNLTQNRGLEPTCHSVSWALVLAQRRKQVQEAEIAPLGSRANLCKIKVGSSHGLFLGYWWYFVVESQSSLHYVLSNDDWKEYISHRTNLYKVDANCIQLSRG